MCGTAEQFDDVIAKWPRRAPSEPFHFVVDRARCKEGASWHEGVLGQFVRAVGLNPEAYGSPKDLYRDRALLPAWFWNSWFERSQPWCTNPLATEVWSILLLSKLPPAEHERRLTALFALNNVHVTFEGSAPV